MLFVGGKGKGSSRRIKKKEKVCLATLDEIAPGKKTQDAARGRKNRKISQKGEGEPSFWEVNVGSE